MRKFGLVICTLALFGCNPANGMSDEEKALAVIRQTGSLYDPDSVKVRNVYNAPPLKGDSGEIYNNFWCGEFNAKNIYGAYTGYKPFVMIIEPDAPDAPTKQPIVGAAFLDPGDGLMRKWCGGH